jgi:hypothetical protein
MKTVKKSGLVRWLAVAVAVAGLAASAAAQDSQFAKADEIQLVDGSTIDLIIASLERNGFTVELTTDSGGDPMIRSTDRNAPFSVFFYSCTNGADCGYIQFSTGWSMPNGITLAKIEEWNATKSFGQAFRNADKNPWLAMVVNLKGGVTVENFDDTVDWWRVIIASFEEHIGWGE